MSGSKGPLSFHYARAKRSILNPQRMKRTARILTLSLLLASAVGVSAFSFALNRQTPADVTRAATDYSAAQTAYANSDADALFSALRTISLPNTQSGSYSKLWDTYKTAYVRANGTMMDYYSSSSSYKPGTDQAGSYSGEGDKYNREHSIPKSWWGGSESLQGADPYIVVPTDGYVNGRRSNYPFGMVKSATYTSSGGFSKLGSADTSWGYSGTVFEPDDSLKGDFARIYFYAVTKYTGAGGWTSGEGSSCFSTSGTHGLTPYAVKLFNAWHALDPVDDWERSVNGKLTTIQGHPNPYVDHPEYASLIWAGQGGEPTPSVSLSETEIDLEVGQNAELTVNCSVSATLTLSVDYPAILDISKSSVSSGGKVTLTAVSEGNATVTASATIQYHVYEAECVVHVTDSTPTPEPEPVTGVPYSLVTDASALKAGDRLVFGRADRSVVAGAHSGKILSKVDQTYADEGASIASLASEAVVWTLGGKSGAWTFHNGTGLLGAATNKDLKIDDGTTTWTIAISGGHAAVTNTNSSSGILLYNVSSPRFKAYGAASGTLIPIDIYRENPDYFAASFATSFLASFTCDSTGASAPTFHTAWNTMGIAFAFLSEQAQGLLSGAASSTSGNVIARAVARYDYVVGKYGYDDFMERSPSPLKSYQAKPMAEEGVAIAVPFIIAFVGALGAATYVFLRKKYRA